MAQDKEKLKTVRERTDRLRERTRRAQADNREDPMPGIVLGVLDLLDDVLK